MDQRRAREMQMVLMEAVVELKGKIPETTATEIEPINKKRFGKHKKGWRITIWFD